MGYYSAMEKNGTLPFAAVWMDLLCLVKCQIKMNTI